MPPCLGALKAVGFHVFNLLVNGLKRAGVEDLLQLCTAGPPQSPGTARQAGRGVHGGGYCQTWK